MVSPIDGDKRIAFVVGALTGKELTGGKRDVSRVYTVLTAPNLGGCDNYSSPSPISECSSKGQFEEALDNILSLWRGTDQLIFYFTGHGKIQNDTYCIQVGPSDKELYPFVNFLNNLKFKGVRKAILILDTCYSGAATKIKSSEHLPSFEQFTLPRGIAILASSRGTETSIELPDGSSSLFTHLFCEGIETGLDKKQTSDGLITVGDITNFVSEKLEKDEQYASVLQRPLMNIDSANRDIWISKNPNGTFNRNLKSSQIRVVQSIEELEMLYKKTQPDKYPCPDASFDDLNWDLVEELHAKTYPELPQNQSREEILNILKLNSPIPINGKQVLHKSAVLCFAHKPELFYEQAKSMFVIGNPGDDNFEREEVTGPLSSQVTKLLDRVKNNLRTVSFIADDGRRQSKLEINLDVVRELISNAITHRDYNLNGVVTVTLTEKALEIRSPGIFPPTTSWDAFLKSNNPVSSPVNLAISHYQSNLLVFEGIGRGFDIFKQYIDEYGEDSITCEILPGPTILIRVSRQSNKKLINKREIAEKSEFQDSAQGVTFPIINLPPVNPNFVGRANQLIALNEVQSENGTPIIQTISGLGGVGKSQLMLQFAHRHRHMYDIVWWFRVDEALTEDYIALGRQLVLPVEGEEQEAAVQLVRNWLNSTKKKWLLLYDNADTIEPRELRRQLPTSPNGRILITSRNPGWGNFSNTVLLDVFSEQEAMVYLTERLGKGDDESRMKLSTELGFFPLALEHAATYMAENDFSSARYLTLFQGRRNELWQYTTPPDDYHATITTTWELAFNEVNQFPGAAELFNLCCFLAPNDVPLAPFVDNANKLPGDLEWILGDELVLNGILKILERYSLINRTNDFVSIHRLVQTVARDRMGEERLKVWLEAAVDCLFAVYNFDQHNVSTWNVSTQLLRHLINVVHLATKFDIFNNRIAYLNNQVGIYFSFFGNFIQAKPFYERALAIREQVLGAEHPDTALSLNNLGYLLRAMGDLARARPYYERALAIHEQVLGSEHPDTATSLNNMGYLLQEMGDLAGAKPYYERALVIRKQVLGADHPDTATSLNNIGYLLQAMGDLAGAKPYYERALAIRREGLGGRASRYGY